MLCLRSNCLATFKTLKSLRKCPKLKALDLDGNNQFGGKNIFDELKNCKALKYFHLSKWENWDGLVDFVQHSQIQYLGLNGCLNLPENVLEALITECDSLTHLEILNNDEDYYNVLLQVLSEKCPKRSNVLKLAVIQKDSKKVWPPSKWCEIIICAFFKPYQTPFSHFTNVRLQYDGN